MKRFMVMALTVSVFAMLGCMGGTSNPLSGSGTPDDTDSGNVENTGGVVDNTGNNGVIDDNTGNTTPALTPAQARAQIQALGVTYNEAAFIGAIQSYNVELVDLFLKGNMSPDTENESGYPALSVSVQYDDNEAGSLLDIMSKLIANNATVDKASNNNSARTPVGLAALSGELEKTRLLIDANADVNIVDGFGEPPLTAASRKGYKEVVKILIAAGADVFAKNSQGDTALDWAESRGHTEIATILLGLMIPPTDG